MPPPDALIAPFGGSARSAARSAPEHVGQCAYLPWPHAARGSSRAIAGRQALSLTARVNRSLARMVNVSKAKRVAAPRHRLWNSWQRRRSYQTKGLAPYRWVALASQGALWTSIWLG
jgi:hypothetical protein